MASLSNALVSKSGSPGMNLIGREISWQKALAGWRVKAAHYPKKWNTAADALSRLSAPDPLPRPDSALRGANLRLPPVQDELLWLIRFDRDGGGEVD